MITRILPKIVPAALGLLVLLWGNGASGNSPTPLTADLSAGEAPGEVIFTLRNEGASSVSVLRHDTPLEAPLAADVFDVRPTSEAVPGEAAREAARATYTGRLYKRAAPLSGDFVTIPPGESVAVTIDLERFYEVASAGSYRIDYRGSVRHARSAEAFGRAGSIAARAGLAETALTARGPEIALAPGALSLRARPPQFNGCSAGQQGVLVEATAAAEGIAGEALSSLQELPEADRAGSPRYETWFGAHAPVRYERVTRNFSRILGALAGETLTYDCTCRESAFAYVFPNQPYDVYMCPAFFRANVLGTDSRAGTLVHELSHFTLLAGTDDIAYGHSLAASLAESDPDRAVLNADSYEYFAENTPALPMSGNGGAPTDPQPPSPSGSLTLGVPVEGSLATGESAVYTVSGAETVSLTSLSGDADLFVFDSSTFDEDTLLCLSNEELPLDVCSLPDGGTYYVGVEAYAAATFSLVSEAADAPIDPGTPPGVPVPAPPDDGTNAPPLAFGGGSGGGALGWLWLLGGTLSLAARRAARAPGARRDGTRR